MVDTEGPVEVESQRINGWRGEDRKVNQILLELRREYSHCLTAGIGLTIGGAGR